MKAVCARCKAEGKSGVIGERPPIDDLTEIYGICWTHKLELLARTQPTFGVAEGPRGERWLRFLVVVASSQPELLARVSEQFLHDSRVRVLADRRADERRQRAERRDPDRRASDRRRLPDYWEDLRYHPVIIVPTWKQADQAARPWAAVATPEGALAGPRAALAASDLLVPAMDRVERWVRDGQELFVHLVPTVVDECEALQRRSDAAERRAGELARTFGDLQAELTRLQAEIERLRRARAATADSIRSCLTEIVRAVSEILAKIPATTD